MAALSEQEEFELLSLERERANGGTEVGGLTPEGKIQKGSLTPSDKVALLKSQLSDPERNMAFDSELQSAIAQAERQAAAPPAPAAAPSAPRASQADVRASERGSLAIQDHDEQVYDAALQAWLKTPKGQAYRFAPYNNPDTQRAAFTKATGRADPRPNRPQAETEHLREGGDIGDVIGNSMPYNVAKAGAAIAGGAFAGPKGATAAEALVRAVSVAENVDRAVRNGVMDPDKAWDVIVNEVSKGVGQDALFNFGVPILGQIAAKIPGAKWLAERVGKLTGGATTATGKQLDMANRKQFTDIPERKAAVDELDKRMKDDHILTPGQVRGETTTSEDVARSMNPKEFGKQERAVQQAAQDLGRDTLYPPTQPSAENMGKSVLQNADDAVQAVKTRLRPTFEAADKLGVHVDMQDTADVIRKALAEDAKVAGRRLEPSERAHLQSILDDLENGVHSPQMRPMQGPEATLDFISRQKEKVRAVTADWKPTNYFETVMNKIIDSADTSFAQAAGKAGKGDVVKNLLAARQDYKEMMSTVYDDAIKAALKKNPEDIGRHFWAGGNVSEIKQLKQMFDIARREGTMTEDQIRQATGDMTRGFLQESAQTLGDMAQWSNTVRTNPVKARTWETLISMPGGDKIEQSVKVLEQAAQMALRNTAEGGQNVAVSRVAKGAGFSMVTGTISLPMVGAHVMTAGALKMIATAYTHGDKGLFNAWLRLMRAGPQGAGNAATAKAAQAAYEEVKRYADKYGIQVFADDEEQK